MSAFLASLASFLFKYPPRDFADGTLGLAPVVPIAWIAAGGGVALAFVAWRHARLQGLSTGRRVGLGMLRAALLLLALGLLARPVLVVTEATPRRNAVLVLYDDSRSMRVADAVDGSSRIAAVQGAFADSSPVLRTLAERFTLRPQRLGADLSPVAGAGALTGAASRSDLAGALATALDLAGGAPTAGVLLVSDGAATPPAADDEPLADVLARYRARGLPVHTVGVGAPRLARNVAVADVTLPPRTLTGAALDVTVRLRTRGVDGETLRVVVTRDGRQVAERRVTAGDDRDALAVSLPVPLLEPGIAELAVRVDSIAGEALTEDNAWSAPIVVEAGPRRVLYVEGEPRPEFAFLRRALAGDSAIRVVGLLRSAPAKYLRLGVRDSLELYGGLPVERATLFDFDAVVLGSFEASAMTGDQRAMLADFVERRGGGLLALGGRDAFAEGGYAGTPLADVLPVAFDRAALASDAPVRWLQIVPTAAGRRHPALRLLPPDSGRITPWDSLPPITAVNAPGTPRAGATVLLEASVDGAREPVLVAHRYGRGTAAVLGVQDTWLWRMDTRIAVEDVTHRTIWRQLLRWLVADVPSRVRVAAEPARAAAGEPVTIVAELADSAWTPASARTVVAEVESRDGRLDSVPLRPDVARPGTWRGTTRLEGDGLREVRLLAGEVGGVTGVVDTARAALLLGGTGTDLATVERDDARLRAIADATGGTFRTVDALEGLADDLVRTESGIVVRDARDLWDMPAVLAVMLLLLAAEWTWRRRAGLA